MLTNCAWTLWIPSKANECKEWINAIRFSPIEFKYGLLNRKFASYEYRMCVDITAKLKDSFEAFTTGRRDGNMNGEHKRSVGLLTIAFTLSDLSRATLIVLVSLAALFELPPNNASGSLKSNNSNVVPQILKCVSVKSWKACRKKTVFVIRLLLEKQFSERVKILSNWGKYAVQCKEIDRRTLHLFQFPFLDSQLKRKWTSSAFFSSETD